MTHSKSTIQQIIAMGGGGFSMEPENPALDDYVLAQCKAACPKICLIPTASGDNMELIRGFYDYCMTRNCSPSHLSLHNPAARDIESFLMENDILYVTGGHTGRMLMIWKAFQLDIILKKAWKHGIILAGVSAGATCWFEYGLTDSNASGLGPEQCLGFLKGSHCSHYETPGRRPAFHQAILAGQLPAGFGTDNFAALHFIGSRLQRVICSRPNAASHHVEIRNQTIQESPLPAAAIF